MGDRINGLVVALEPNTHEDDAKRIADAIQLLVGVVSVARAAPTRMDMHLAREQVRRDLRERLWKALDEEDDRG